MRVFAISDLHVDYEPNRVFVDTLSLVDFRDDLLIVAGDLSHHAERLESALLALHKRFKALWFVPGNHDLWVSGQSAENSFDRCLALLSRLRELGIRTEPATLEGTTIIPLLSWYDFSFGQPCSKLQRGWRDFVRCRWPDNWSAAEISAAFLAENPTPVPIQAAGAEQRRITVSHFMPRADLLPRQAVERYGFLLPILGGHSIDRALRAWAPQIHVYGHSHVPVDQVRNGIRYINNAKGYPSEYRYADRQLKRIA